jgi:L-alanine-DL-glutamate epimerase-like enolase superfamily enzyme
VQRESWPLAQPFSISRGTKTTADVVVATITDGIHSGRGEAVPYARYGETIDGVISAVSGARFSDRTSLQDALPAGAARNALDCALWDFDAKRNGISAASRAGLLHLAPVLTAYTISLGTPDAMAAAARAVPHLPLLKLKLGGPGDAERLAAVRAARPEARLIADANEAWTPALLPELLAAAATAGIETIEQPLPADADAALEGLSAAIPICADESVHTAADLPGLASRYGAVNIKLDKAGGLTEALELLRAAKSQGYRIMIGSMVSTSLGIAPAFLLAQGADWVDLDGPLLLKQDRKPGFVIESGIMSPPSADLWG